MASYLRTLLRYSNISNEELKREIGHAWCPVQYETEDFKALFLNRLTIIGDSREQNDWIEKACLYYGIRYAKAVKDKKAGTENLKEGDYTFKLDYGVTQFDFTGKVAYERKGSLSEIYNNLKSKDRERIEREFKRFGEKGYKKVVMILEYGSNVSDLLNGKFEFIDHYGINNDRDVGKLVFSSLMSWKQPNAYNFEIYQDENHTDTFWFMVMDMYYYFRNELKRRLENETASNEN